MANLAQLVANNRPPLRRKPFIARELHFDAPHRRFPLRYTRFRWEHIAALAILRAHSVPQMPDADGEYESE